MQFGAHETMETHEILLEKINAITHFNIYAKAARNPQLMEMIVRHQQEEIRSYNELVALTRGSNRFAPIASNTMVRGVTNQQVQYGLNNPPQFAPQPDGLLNDTEIAIAMLLCHKNGARNGMWASLECADPNLRRALLNSAATCNNQAYEVFLFLNQQGVYQVPTLKDRTMETFLNSYQPAPASLQNQYAVGNTGVSGYAGTTAGAAGYGATWQTNMGGTTPTMMDGQFNTGARNSVLYGTGNGDITFPNRPTVGVPGQVR